VRNANDAWIDLGGSKHGMVSDRCGLLDL